jgi:tRNA dimethylallyltransferase
MSNSLYVLTGCTAVGKTELALRWAEASDAEIVSCDSLLFYRGMNVGTAKPTRAELGRVPHHLIDVRGVNEPMDITEYVTMARAAVAEVVNRGKRVLVTGGSGFYLKAFFAPVADDVAVPANVRQELNERLVKEGLGALIDELHRLNPAGVGSLDVQNPRRVLRALERCRVSGKTLHELKSDFERLPSAFADYEVKLCELVRPREELDRRIEQRVEAMMGAGLVEEVRGLIDAGLKQNPSAAKAIGYRETIDFIEGRLTESELPASIVRNTHGLVKKQRTWFKTQLPVHAQIEAGSAQVEGLFA